MWAPEEGPSVLCVLIITLSSAAPFMSSAPNSRHEPLLAEAQRAPKYHDEQPSPEVVDSTHHRRRSEEDDEGDDEGGVQTDDGGFQTDENRRHSRNNSPELESLSSGMVPSVTAGGYNSDTTGQLSRELSRLPRASYHAARPLTFGGGVGARRSSHAAQNVRGVSQRSGSGPSNRQGRKVSSAAASRLRSVEDDEDEDYSGYRASGHNSGMSYQPRGSYATVDPLVWNGGSSGTGNSPRPTGSIGAGLIGAPADASSAFSIPPLMSAVAPRERSHSFNGDGGMPPSEILRCSSYCVAVGLNLRTLYRALVAYGRPCAEHKDGINYVLHCTEPDNGREGGAHSFFFSYGCVVTWGLSERQEWERLQLLTTANCTVEPLDVHEADDFGYTHIAGVGKPAFVKDVLTLSTTDVREKLAVSFALAQSVKLGVFERTVEQLIEETRDIPERMAKTGTVRLKRSTITKRIGQLFVDRASINLHSDILDHPDFFWEDDEWLPLYMRYALSAHIRVHSSIRPINVHALCLATSRPSLYPCPPLRS